MFPPDAVETPATGETPPQPQPVPSPDPKPPEPPTQPKADEDPKDEGRVPYERFKSVSEENAEMKKRIEELETETLSEKERAERRAAAAEKKAEESERRALRLERSGIARQAAVDQGFIDTEDAIALIDLEALDSDAKIRNAIEKLAERKPHLIRRATPGFGNPGGAGLPQTDVPLDEDGKPDERAALGADLRQHLFGRRR